MAKVEIPSTFHKWAIKYLKEEQSKVTVDRDEIKKSQQKRLDSCARKQDALFEMRINGEIDASEYIQRKEKFTEEKQRFESGNLAVKREILACLGSNLILLDRKLNIQLQEPLSIFTKYSPGLKYFVIG